MPTSSLPRSKQSSRLVARFWWFVLLASPLILFCWLFLMLNPSARAAADAWWGRSLPGVDTVRVGDGLVEVKARPGISLSDAPSLFKQAAGRRSTRVTMGDVTWWDVSDSPDPRALGELAWWIAQDKDLAGDAKTYGTGDDKKKATLWLRCDTSDDCRDTISRAWDHVRGASPIVEGANLSGRRAAIESESGVDLDATDRLVQAALDLGGAQAGWTVTHREDTLRLNVDVDTRDQVEPTRQRLLTSLAGLDVDLRVGTDAEEAYDSWTIIGSGDSSEAVAFSDDLEKVGIRAYALWTDRSRANLVLGDASRGTALVDVLARHPGWGELSVIVGEGHGWYSGPAADLPTYTPLLTALAAAGTPASWSAQALTVNPGQATSCEQPTLSCAQLVDQLAALPGPVTIRIDDHTSVQLLPGQKATDRRGGQSPWLDAVVAAWDARN